MDTDPKVSKLLVNECLVNIGTDPKGDELNTAKQLLFIYYSYSVMP